MSIITKNIGSLSGKILVFGGVYSNLQALHALHDAAAKHKISADHIICTGDIAGYCAQPAACLDFIAQWDIHCIQGNVEQNLLSGADDCGCNFTEGGRCDLLSKQWFPYAMSNVTETNRHFLRILPHHLTFQYAGRRFTVVHGSATDISAFVFRSTPWEIKRKNFEITNSEVILAGHCGLPFSDSMEDLYWLNAGVIGMPANDGTPDTWYMILNDDDGLQYSFCRLQYDYESAANLMTSSNLPTTYAKTLTTGIWDNCEILPDIEKSWQGKEIRL